MRACIYIYIYIYAYDDGDVWPVSQCSRVTTVGLHGVTRLCIARQDRLHAPTRTCNGDSWPAGHKSSEIGVNYSAGWRAGGRVGGWVGRQAGRRADGLADGCRDARTYSSHAAEENGKWGTTGGRAGGRAGGRTGGPKTTDFRDVFRPGHLSDGRRSKDFISISPYASIYHPVPYALCYAVTDVYHGDIYIYIYIYI